MLDPNYSTREWEHMSITVQLKHIHETYRQHHVQWWDNIIGYHEHSRMEFAHISFTNSLLSTIIIIFFREMPNEQPVWYYLHCLVIYLYHCRLIVMLITSNHLNLLVSNYKYLSESPYYAYQSFRVNYTPFFFQL